MKSTVYLSQILSDLAMEISLIDSEFFSVIPKNEFLKQKWAKKNPEINAPYITNCIENFNNVSCILLFNQKKKN